MPDSAHCTFPAISTLRSWAFLLVTSVNARRALPQWPHGGLWTQTKPQNLPWTPSITQGAYPFKHDGIHLVELGGRVSWQLRVVLGLAASALTYYAPLGTRPTQQTSATWTHIPARAGKPKRPWWLGPELSLSARATSGPNSFSIWNIVSHLFLFSCSCTSDLGFPRVVCGPGWYIKPLHLPSIPLQLSGTL